MSVRRTTERLATAFAVVLLLSTLFSGTGNLRAESLAATEHRALDPHPARPAAQRNFGDPQALAPGKFLVAGRALDDPNFSRTVVLLVEYGPGGALGLIVNRPTPMTLAALLPDLDSPGGDTAIFIGGPVSRGSLRLLAGSDADLEDAHEVVEGVHFGWSLELLVRLAARGSKRVRIYAGYAGWSAGQLESEVERGDWYVVPADRRSVFDAEPGDLWRLLLPADPSRSAALRLREVTPSRF